MNKQELFKKIISDLEVLSVNPMPETLKVLILQMMETVYTQGMLDGIETAEKIQKNISQN